MPYLSAIDLGFIYTKAIVNNIPIIIESVAGEGKELKFKDLDFGLKEGETRNNITCRNSQGVYFAADLAVSQSETIYHSLKSDRFDSNVTRILLQAVLGMGFGNGNHISYVVSGLPVNHYNKFKTDIKNLFLGSKHEYDVSADYYNKDTNIRVKGDYKGFTTFVEGKFIPQPFGAGMHIVLDDDGSIKDKNLASKTIAILDPGFGTTDVYVMNTLSPVEKLSFSTDTAMNHAYRLISNKIEEKFEVTLPLYTIENIIKTGVFSKSGVSYSMINVINWAYKATGAQLVSELMNKWKTNLYEIDHIYIVGGGGIALSPHILPEFSNATLVEDSQWAVVKGYQKWGRRSWKNII